ncbi:MAG: glycosyltransferase [Acidimicrobiales bacterium]|nr:glycosyltransferase [Acidimicrobiales bacterium]
MTIPRTGPDPGGSAAMTAATTTARASIVIPLWNKVEVTLRCLEALIANTTEGTYHVVLVDNASTDGTGELLDSLEGDVTIIRNTENLGYTLASNQGAAATDHEVVVFLNNDTEPMPGWLDALLDCLDRHPEAAVVGSRLVYPDGRLQEAGALIFDDGTGWNFGRLSDPTLPVFERACEVDYCSGASLAARRSFLDEVDGGYDPRYAPAYYEDVDLCFAARANGWTVRYEPSSVVVHHEGVTAGTDLASGYKAYQELHRGVFVDKWAHVLPEQGPSPQRAGQEPATNDRHRRPCGVPRRARPADRRPGPPRVLLVDPFMPMRDRSAGSLRTFRVLEAMADAGYAVTFIGRNGYRQERYERELARLGIRVYRSDRARLQELGEDDPTVPFLDLERIIAESDFDLAWLDFFDLGATYAPYLRDRSPRTQVWIDSVDVHHVRQRRQAEVAQALGDPTAADQFALAEQVRVREQWSYGLADGLVAVTEADADELRALAPGVPVGIVPTIHALAAEVAPLEERSGLLFVGGFAHPPNVDAVAWLCTELMPAIRRRVPDATCTVVGPDAPPELSRMMAATPGVTELGWVPETFPFVQAARVSLAPLRFGAGIKGKIGEALAAGLPVVTTSIGAEGMALHDGVDVRIGDSATAFAGAVERLLTDDDAWQAQSAAGRALADERFSPRVVAAAVRSVVEHVVAAEPPAGASERQPCGAML